MQRWGSCTNAAPLARRAAGCRRLGGAVGSRQRAVPRSPRATAQGAACSGGCLGRWRSQAPQQPQIMTLPRSRVRRGNKSNKSNRHNRRSQRSREASLQPMRNNPLPQERRLALLPLRLLLTARERSAAALVFSAAKRTTLRLKGSQRWKALKSRRGCLAGKVFLAARRLRTAGPRRAPLRRRRRKRRRPSGASTSAHRGSARARARQRATRQLRQSWKATKGAKRSWSARQ
mmetsp:Transcript_15431/g.39868  ORF Transcript_15431/g.39868 Transcript_15431/m.39868 type:complete len:232 (+) Transcript_15431:138-833(+)